MKVEQIRAVQDFLQFESILDSGIIKMKDSSYILIMEVKPIIFNLKSELEKSNILNSYKMLFQNYSLNLQILILSKKEDFEKHISKVKNKEELIELYKKHLKIYIDELIKKANNTIWQKIHGFFTKL